MVTTLCNNNCEYSLIGWTRDLKGEDNWRGRSSRQTPRLRPLERCLNIMIILRTGTHNNAEKMILPSST